MLPGREAKGLQKVLFLGFWILVFPIALVAALLVLPLVFRDGLNVAAAGVLLVSVGLLFLSYRWFMELRGQQIREGTWKASLRMGLGVGAVIAAAQVVRALLGDG